MVAKAPSHNQDKEGFSLDDDDDLGEDGFNVNDDDDLGEDLWLVDEDGPTCCTSNVAEALPLLQMLFAPGIENFCKEKYETDFVSFLLFTLYFTQCTSQWNCFFYFLHFFNSLKFLP